MANKNYQIGGILAALNEEPDQTENEEENNLSKLFSFKSTEKEEPDIVRKIIIIVYLFLKCTIIHWCGPLKC